MKYLAGVLLLICSMNTETLFDFSKKSDTRYWRIVDDGVMGGLSNGTFSISPEGHGVFQGTISLENNGGFSSLRYGFNTVEVNPGKTKVHIRLKGDGKRYQFRVKHNMRAYYSYQRYFETSGDWETIEIPLSEMIPTFRGNKLNLPNFDHDRIQEVTFLFGNKKEESFKLLVDKISLVSE